jgi:metal-dependent amidase/aminoacylase/carboxypeptidase family protein
MDSIALRHKLHGIPELAFEEHKTKALLMQSLNVLQLDKKWSIHQFGSNPGLLWNTEVWGREFGKL